MSDMYVHGNDVEGKPLQEDVITREAASKSVHVLGQGNPNSLILQHTANLHAVMPCVICNLEGATATQPAVTFLRALACALISRWIFACICIAYHHLYA